MFTHTEGPYGAHAEITKYVHCYFDTLCLLWINRTKSTKNSKK